MNICVRMFHLGLEEDQLDDVAFVKVSYQLRVELIQQHAHSVAV